jgi:hypothetical protein
MATDLTRKKVAGWTIAIVVFLLFISTGKLVTLLTDFLWFKELRLTSVFLITLYSKIWCGVIVGIVAWVMIYANIFLARRMVAGSQPFSGFLNMRIIQVVNLVPLLNLVLILASLIVSLFIGVWASNFWEIYQKFIHAASFGLNDPLFGKDISFYVFKLPFYRFVFQSVLTILVFSFIGGLLVYIL